MSILPSLAVGLCVLMIYQGIELSWKLNLIRSLHRIEHPESVEYSTSLYRASLSHLQSKTQATWVETILPSFLSLCQRRL